MNSPIALKVSNLKKIYSDGTSALHGIDFKVYQGDFFGLLGPNGAGKTTTIEIISSITNKTSGNIIIDGIDADIHFAIAKSKIGVVPQELNFNVFETPLQIITKQAGYYGIRYKIAFPRAKYLLKKLYLWDKKNTQCRHLSGGMKRRLMIARGLIHNPKILILDEPTSGVDVEIRRDILNFIREINNNGTTIILTTHYLEEAESLCNKIAILNKGRIVTQSPIKDLIQNLEEEYFILNTAEPVSQLPIIDNYQLNIIDRNTISAQITKKQTINNLFEELSKHNIQILTLRNKANRLEEYFIKLTSNIN